MYPIRTRALPLLCGLVLAAAPAAAQDDARKAPASFERVDHLAWDDDHATPVFVSGALRAASSAAPAHIAEAFLDENAAWLGLGGRSDFAVLAVDREDKSGLQHVRVAQEVGGVPVYGAESIVHIDRSGAVYAFGGTVEAGAARVLTQPAIGEQAALRAARATLAPGAILAVDAVAPEERAALAVAPSVRLVVYPEADGAFRLAYHADLQVAAPDPARWQVFVDAMTGDVFHLFNAIHTAEGHGAGVRVEAHVAHGEERVAAGAPASMGPTVGSGTSVFGGTKTLNTEYANGSYRLRDLTRTSSYIRTMTAGNGYSLPGGYITDADNQFTATYQRPGVDAHWGAAKTYDYFKNTHNRNSYDGAGASITSTVNYRSSYNNAFWNGSQMVYGNGDGYTFRALVALDIVAHELTHAVTEYTAGLIYQNASGALNEAVSDIFGAMVDRDDWLMGEDSYTPGTSGDALRYLNNPPLGNQPDHYSDRYTGTGDNGGVHINSGIFNKAAYLMAAGGTHRGVSVASMGRYKTERVWYRALTRYFTSSTGYSGARAGVLQATADLYGSGSAAYATVQSAFAAVGIGSAPGPLVATASGPSTILSGQSGTFRASATGGTSPYTFTWQVKPICSTPDPEPEPEPEPDPDPYPEPDPLPWPDPNPCDPWDPHCQIPLDGNTGDKAEPVGDEGGELLRGPACNVWSYAGSGASLSYSPGANGLAYGTFYMRALARDAQNATDYSNQLYVTYSPNSPSPEPDPWPDPNPCDPWDPHCQIPFGEDGASLVADVVPEALIMEQARPNPFSDRAELSIGVPETASAHVAAYDLLGREVAVLHAGTLPAGWHRATLDGSQLAPGVYVIRAVVGGEAVTARVTRVD